MPSRHLRLIGSSAVERHLLTSRLVDAIEGADGVIVDAQLYSSAAVTIRFDMACAALADFGRALHAAGVTLDAASEAAIAALSAGTGKIPGTAAITFRR